MTTEEKARAYDKAIEKIKYVMEHGVSPTLNKEDLQDLFPELAESEDERIRKWLEETIEAMPENSIDFRDVRRIDVLHWLEKQGKQKPIETTWKPSEEQIKILNEILNFAANHECPYWNDYIFGTLNNLIRQLKKLKA